MTSWRSNTIAATPALVSLPAPVRIVRRPITSAVLGLCLGRLGYGNTDPVSNGERRFIRGLRLKPGAVVLDVGANTGGWALLLRSVAPQVELHCFEPSPVAFRELHQKLQLPNVKLHQLAVTNHDGQATLYTTHPGAELASLYRRDLRHVGLSMVGQETVQTITLDHFCRTQQIGEVALLKIDVEGAELDVLSGGTATLRSALAVQFEYGGTSLDAGVRLRDFYDVLEGFDLYRITGAGLLPLGRYRERYELPEYVNFAALRR